MPILLQPATEARIQRELERGAYASTDELLTHALDLVSSEEDWLLRNKDAINAMLEESFAEAERGEGHTLEEVEALLTRRATNRAA